MRPLGRREPWSQDWPKSLNSATVSAFASLRYGKPGVDQVSNEWMDYYTAGLSLQWNLWSWGGDRARVEQQEVAARGLAEQEAKLKNDVEQQLQSILVDIDVLNETRTLLDAQISQESQKQDMLRARFEQEARAVNSIGHPGVVEILDIDVTDDGLGINNLSLSGDDAALFEIVGLARQGLESIGLHEKILLSDQAKEGLCDDQPTPAYIDTGTAPRRTTSTARGSDREHRADRDDARTSRSRRAGERRPNGGAR